MLSHEPVTKEYTRQITAEHMLKLHFTVAPGVISSHPMTQKSLEYPTLEPPRGQRAPAPNPPHDSQMTADATQSPTLRPIISSDPRRHGRIHRVSGGRARRPERRRVPATSEQRKRPESAAVAVYLEQRSPAVRWRAACRRLGSGGRPVWVAAAAARGDRWPGPPPNCALTAHSRLGSLVPAVPTDRSAGPLSGPVSGTSLWTGQRDLSLDWSARPLSGPVSGTSLWTGQWDLSLDQWDGSLRTGGPVTQPSVPTYRSRGPAGPSGPITSRQKLEFQITPSDTGARSARWRLSRRYRETEALSAHSRRP